MLGPMRDAYHEQLDELAEGLADMCAAIGQAMGDATTALLECDLATAQQVISADTAVDEARSVTEERAYALLALQAPVATDLRTVVAAIHAAESLERMGDLARHVAKTARRRHPAPALPASVRPQFARMGRLAGGQARAAEQVIRSRDVSLARQVEYADDAMDALHRDLFTVLMASNWPHGVTAAVDVTQLSRFYERYADHAVSVARRTVFVVTGRMPSATSGAGAE